MDPGTTPPLEMTLAQLRTEFKALGAHVSDIGARRQALHTEYQRRLDLNRMQQQVNTLTPGQREAVRQILCT